jgi:hypothetical protein
MTDLPRPAAPSAAGGDASGPQVAFLVQVNAPGGGGVVNALQGGVLASYRADADTVGHRHVIGIGYGQTSGNDRLAIRLAAEEGPLP